MKILTIIVLLMSNHSLWADTSMTLGPYESQEELREATSFLNSHQIRFQLNDDAVVESLGFIVVTDPMSLSLADLLVTDLREQGFSDLLYIRHGVYQGRVSAGIYSSVSGAGKRAEKLSDSSGKFKVIERSRTVFSSTITVMPGDVNPSAVISFEAFTGLSVPAIKSETAQIKRPGKGVEVKETAAEERLMEITNTPEPSSKADLQKTRKPPDGQEKIVITNEPQEDSDFPFTPFLLIAVSLLIITSGFFFFIKHRVRKNHLQPEENARFEEVKKPPTLSTEQEVPQLPERQLDGSVGAISAYANQILSGQIPGKDEIPQYLATIQMGGTEVLDLISDIIDLSRIEIGQVEIERISFDPESALQDLIKSLLPKSDDKGISLQFTPHENLPDLIASDLGKLEKIVVPLVRHAIECTSSGRVSVSALFDESSELLEIAIKHSADSLSPTQIEELFEASGSIADISNEKTLRFAVSKRLANLLGGDIQMSHDSSHDITYLVKIRADEILKKQLLLPSGMSIDELVESESRAVQQMENAQAGLESARKEAQLAALALTELEEQARVLTGELETAQSLASENKLARSQLDSQTREAIDKLNLDLDNTRNKLQTELDSLSQSEAAANSRAIELETSLSQAIAEAQNQTTARQEADQAARDQVKLLSTQLADAETQLVDAQAHRDAYARQRQADSANKKVVEELRATLGEVEARLEERSEETSESSSQIKALQSELEESKVFSDREAENRLHLENKVDELTQDWEAARKNLESQLSKSNQLAGDNQLQAENLASALKKARQNVIGQEKQYEQLELESSEQLKGLELELEIARQQAIEGSKQSEDSMAKAEEELNSLRRQLILAETSFKKNLDEDNNQHGEELSALQSALSLAELNLNAATNIKVRVEESSGSQIETLINDVNQARATARKETEARVETERETQRQIDLMAAELKEAGKLLETEASTHRELERVTEFARKTSQRLGQAEARVKQLQAEKQLAESLVVANNTAATSVSSMDLTQVVPSILMSHPVMRAMVERFRERLTYQLGVMDRSIQQENYLNLLVSVNWLKGEANNLEFSHFDAIISELELCLRQQSFEQIPDLISKLKNIASRIEIPDIKIDDGASLGVKPQKQGGPINLELPDNDRKAELQENFISQLGSILLEMDAAWQEGDARQLEKNCKWIHRYSIKMKLDTITTSTVKLQSALKRSDPDQISQRMWDFFSLYSNISIVRR